MSSKLIDSIIDTKNRSTNLKIVFVDVVAYSQRRSQTQAQVIDALMKSLEKARSETAKNYIQYCEDNGVNFRSDLILIPSGDGAAVCFPFEGMHDVHLFFAKQILKEVHAANSASHCAKFGEQGWCNCHANFNLAVGVSEGKGIIYRDVNDNYNVAGTVINLAARVMNLAERSQIIFTEDAYRGLIDVVNDPAMDEKFFQFKDVSIKAGQKINIFQYVETGADYLNVAPPKPVAIQQKANEAMKAMERIGFSMPSPHETPDFDKLSFAETFGTLFGPSASSPPTIDGGSRNR